MKIIDITREWVGAPVYPGDPAPALTTFQSMATGDAFNVTAFSGCLHNGTHLDAPLHSIPDGASITDLPLELVVGECSVVAFEGILLGDQAERILPRLHERVLFKGNVAISASAAFVLGDAGVRLIGVEGASVALPEETAAVHRQLQVNGIVLLEGLDLSKADPGAYMLLAAPMKIGGAEAAPVRAMLLERQMYL
ncbi:MAG: cyclase family protein [Acutalibacteraceae bacterium]|jgi:arylformamidase